MSWDGRPSEWTLSPWQGGGGQAALWVVRPYAEQQRARREEAEHRHLVARCLLARPAPGGAACVRWHAHSSACIPIDAMTARGSIRTKCCIKNLPFKTGCT